jgi:AraC-like DNA-binding protein
MTARRSAIPAARGACFTWSRASSRRLPKAWAAADDDRAARLVRALFLAATAGGPLRREELLLQALAALAPDRKSPAIPVRADIARARALIDEDPAAPITLGELAGASGLSRFQLVRAFGRSIGLTPHAYLVQRRTDLARRLIAGGTKLAEVAAAAGFSDQSHMTRIFVARYGLTPGTYAEAVR